MTKNQKKNPAKSPKNNPESVKILSKILQNCYCAHAICGVTIRATNATYSPCARTASAKNRQSLLSADALGTTYIFPLRYALAVSKNTASLRFSRRKCTWRSSAKRRAAAISTFQKQQTLTGVNEMTQRSRLGEAQGRNEQRTELYMKYREGAAQFLTPRFAKSGSSAASFAGRQAEAAGVLR